jgi:ABC-type uncharacterized transport system substrate-binding protein
MHPTDTDCRGCGRHRGWWAALLSFALALTGCANQPAAPAGSPAPTPSGTGIAVVVSSEEQAFQSIARELVLQAGPGIAVHALSETRAGQGALLRTLSRPEVTTVIAVGLPAAQFTRRLAGKRVVFCQVFNYDEAGLLTPGVRGVSALPPLAEPFRLWKAIDPRLERIGVITGPRLGGVVAEARSAARAAGLELVHVEVNSDKETLYAFRRLLPRIQGLWLVPDNRVLSAGVIRDVLAQAVREGRQVLGFRHELLALGALLSAESNPADVANRVLVRVRARPSGTESLEPAVTVLTQADVRVNRVVLQSLGLQLPGDSPWRAHGI